ncbi:hypothetical protein ACOMHN_045915 [Nucella lapillus]
MSGLNACVSLAEPKSRAIPSGELLSGEILFWGAAAVLSGEPLLEELEQQVVQRLDLQLQLSAILQDLHDSDSSS